MTDSTVCYIEGNPVIIKLFANRVHSISHFQEHNIQTTFINVGTSNLFSMTCKG